MAEGRYNAGMPVCLRVVDSITELRPRDAAGIAALELLQAQHLAACTMAHHSARIGEARSTLDQGLLSHVNPAAQALGLRQGQPLQVALRTLWPHHQETSA